MTQDVPQPGSAPAAAPSERPENGSQSYHSDAARSERLRTSRRNRFLAELGLNISRWRKANRMTAADLAESAGVAEQAVTDVEAGAGTPTHGDVMAVVMAVGIADTVVSAANPYNSLSGTVRIEELLQEGGWPEPTPRREGTPEELFFQLVNRYRARSPLTPDLWRSPGIAGRSTRHRNDPRNDEDLAPSAQSDVRDTRQRMAAFLERQDELLPPSYAASMIDAEIFLREIQTEFGFLKGADVAELVGGSDPVFVSDQRRAGSLLALKRMNQWVYPGFQIHDGTIRPVIAQLSALSRKYDLSGRDIIVWLCVRTTFIRGGARPVDYLHDPEFVLKIAQSSWGIVN